MIGAGTAAGRGVAYATANANHLLNVPAARMSIDPVNPGQFTEWLAARGQRMADFAAQFLPVRSMANICRASATRARMVAKA